MVVFLLVAGLLGAQTPPAPAEQQDVDPLTTYEGLAAALATKPKNFYLVDCRTFSEFREGRIPGAINIPVERILNAPPTTDKSATIVLYCRFGNRSDRAYDILESLGYTNLHLFGKMNKWKGEKVR